MAEHQEILNVKQRFGIIGTSPLLDRAIEKAIQVATTDLSVLITGESGVGKENIAQIIHQFSARKHNSYIPVNCGAIPKGTIDSELFGHEKGSYTDAKSDRKGYFEVAEGGTIFLDEVGELPIDVQSKLLRVLESHEYMRVGSSKVQKSNVRVIAATNVDMQTAIANGEFREDLYYRLGTIPITVPPLRERPEDINILFRRFATECAERYHRPVVRLDEQAQELLKNYYWPGNVRQLKNIAEQIAVIENGDNSLTADTLRSYLPSDAQNSNLPTLIHPHNANERTFENEREILYQVLFDMKKDIADLKNAIKIITGKNAPTTTPDLTSNDLSNTTLDANHLQARQNHTIEDLNFLSQTAIEPQQTTVTLPNASTAQQHNTMSSLHGSNIEEAEEYVEESLSLRDAEKDMIQKALAKNNGLRRAAARDLNISERTLYRRIKEYGLD